MSELGNWDELCFAPYMPNTEERAVRSLVRSAFRRAHEINAGYERDERGAAILRPTSAAVGGWLDALAVQEHQKDAKSILHGRALRVLATPKSDSDALHWARLQQVWASEKKAQAQAQYDAPARFDGPVAIELKWREWERLEEARVLHARVEKDLTRAVKRVEAPTRRQQKRRALHRRFALRWA